MKKREIVERLSRFSASDLATQAEVAELRTAVTAATSKLDQVGLDDIASKLSWLEARVDLVAARLENMRGNVTLDAAAAQRLTYAVGQFSARLDRLEAPRPRGRPRKRPLREAQLPAGPNGEPERTQPPPTTADPTGGPPNDPEQPTDPRAND